MTNSKSLLQRNQEGPQQVETQLSVEIVDEYSKPANGG
jgi:hypothetical protein